MVGKLTVSGVRSIMMVYQAELQPTEVRMQGKSLMRLGTKTAAGIAPYIADFPSEAVPKWLPSALLGVCVCVGGPSHSLPLLRHLMLTCLTL
ncbi:hypothetical protein Pcinc_026249 [Petrolisthes cinctipes]|uniref:Uncharacterized protein n=1 Tax=Petrolisthes cinctipes TaxID=88211 RepID=A0AAE1F6H4_PETCI|nr:hypothetical protein Pcinc_026249 [Petrolisthes cinctipes]